MLLRLARNVSRKQMSSWKTGMIGQMMANSRLRYDCLFLVQGSFSNLFIWSWGQPLDHLCIYYSR